MGLAPFILFISFIFNSLIPHIIFDLRTYHQTRDRFTPSPRDWHGVDDGWLRERQPGGWGAPRLGMEGDGGPVRNRRITPVPESPAFPRRVRLMQIYHRGACVSGARD